MQNGDLPEEVTQSTLERAIVVLQEIAEGDRDLPQPQTGIVIVEDGNPLRETDAHSSIIVEEVIEP